MRISDIYKNLVGSPIKWNYYDSSTIFSYDKLFSGNACFNFISQYLTKGEKGDLNCISLLNQLDNHRLQHIISSFFLGFHIYHQCHTIKEKVDKEIEKIRENKQDETTEKRVLYIWMLICLFHDCGYAYEQRRILYRKKDIKKVIKQFFDFKKPTSFPYSKIIIKRYEEYRECKMGVVDHGIIGGALLYKDLVGLRETMSKELHTKRYWGIKLEKDFLYAAWAIVCHNVFKATEGSPEAHFYHFYELDKLVTNDRFIHLSKHPILFLLCLVDSIEPIKQVRDASILDKTGIEIHNDKIVIDFEHQPDEEKARYIKKIKDLNSWLTTTVISDNQIKGTIVLNVSQ